MSFEELKAEVSLLMTEMQNEPSDRHELYLKLMRKINELRAYGMPIPDDLLRFEKALEEEFQRDTEDAKRSLKN